MFRNQELDGGDWLDHVLFDEGTHLLIEKTFDDPAITLDIQTIPLQSNSTPIQSIFLIFLNFFKKRIRQQGKNIGSIQYF